MKKLLILTTLAALTVGSSTGCRLTNWFHRGDHCDSCVSSTVPSCGTNMGPIYSGPTTVVPAVPGSVNRPETLPGPIYNNG